MRRFACWIAGGDADGDPLDPPRRLSLGRRARRRELGVCRLAPVWESAHRFGGRLFVVAGVAAAAMAALAPPAWGFAALGVAIVVAGLGSVAHSYVVWRRLRAADDGAAS